MHSSNPCRSAPSEQIALLKARLKLRTSRKLIRNDPNKDSTSSIFYVYFSIFVDAFSLSASTYLIQDAHGDIQSL